MEQWLRRNYLLFVPRFCRGSAGENMAQWKQAWLRHCVCVCTCICVCKQKKDRALDMCVGVHVCVNVCGLQATVTACVFRQLFEFAKLWLLYDVFLEYGEETFTIHLSSLWISMSVCVNKRANVWHVCVCVCTCMCMCERLWFIIITHYSLVRDTRWSPTKH